MRAPRMGSRSSFPRAWSRIRLRRRPAAAKAGDGTRHGWLEGQALELIVTLDDATGAIDSAFLTEEEGAASTFRALNEVFSEPGLPMSLYTDRGSHDFRTTRGAQAQRYAGSEAGGNRP